MLFLCQAWQCRKYANTVPPIANQNLIQPDIAAWRIALIVNRLDRIPEKTPHPQCASRASPVTEVARLLKISPADRPAVSLRDEAASVHWNFMSASIKFRQAVDRYARR